MAVGWVAAQASASHLPVQIDGSALGDAGDEDAKADKDGAGRPQPPADVRGPMPPRGGEREVSMGAAAACRLGRRLATGRQAARTAVDLRAADGWACLDARAMRGALGSWGVR